MTKKALRKLDRLFRFLGHNDMGKVEGPDLDRYVQEDLFGDDSDVKTVGGYRDHAALLRSAFKRAFVAEKIDQNPTVGHLEITKGGGKRRDVLTPEQFRKIMQAVRRCDDPIVRILGMVMGLSRLRPAELVEASTADFYWQDGELVFRIWEDNRPEGETLKTAEASGF